MTTKSAFSPGSAMDTDSLGLWFGIRTKARQNDPQNRGKKWNFGGFFVKKNVNLCHNITDLDPDRIRYGEAWIRKTCIWGSVFRESGSETVGVISLTDSVWPWWCSPRRGRSCWAWSWAWRCRCCSGWCPRTLPASATGSAPLTAWAFIKTFKFFVNFLTISKHLHIFHPNLWASDQRIIRFSNDRHLFLHICKNIFEAVWGKSAKRQAGQKSQCIPNFARIGTLYYVPYPFS